MNTLHISVTGKVARLTLHRPQARNALDTVLIAELTQAFTTLGAQADVRCIVLTAQGPTFCAGADLHWMHQMAASTEAENLAEASAMAQMPHTLAVTRRRSWPTGVPARKGTKAWPPFCKSASPVGQCDFFHAYHKTAPASRDLCTKLTGRRLQTSRRGTFPLLNQ
jgi:hypothetical protein